MLERNGLIKKESLDTQPPSVQYELTEIGMSAFAIAKQCVTWVNSHEETIITAQSCFDDTVESPLQ